MADEGEVAFRNTVCRYATEVEVHFAQGGEVGVAEEQDLLKCLAYLMVAFSNIGSGKVMGTMESMPEPLALPHCNCNSSRSCHLLGHAQVQSGPIQ